jgi:DNA-binding MarR family transcriptional regulator
MIQNVIKRLEAMGYIEFKSHDDATYVFPLEKLTKAASKDEIIDTITHNMEVE